MLATKRPKSALWLTVSRAEGPQGRPVNLIKTNRDKVLRSGLGSRFLAEVVIGLIAYASAPPANVLPSMNNNSKKVEEVPLPVEHHS